MTYKLDFLEEALEEWNKLNPSIKQPLKKVDQGFGESSHSQKQVVRTP
jgi:mRNA-degrading endonuclease RelE of RelBE toxin-antitoxin system